MGKLLIAALFTFCLGVLRIIGYSFLMLCGLVLIGFGIFLFTTSAATPETVIFFKRMATLVPFAELIPILMTAGFILVGGAIMVEATKRLFGDGERRN